MTKVDNSDLLDNTMKNIFDWSDDSDTVRENLWNYFLELIVFNNIVNES